MATAADSPLEFISKNLQSLGIRRSYATQIESLIGSQIITPDMSPGTAYTNFIIHMSRGDPLFLSILKNEYPFDITLTTSASNCSPATALNSGRRAAADIDVETDRLRKHASSELGDRIKYAHAELRGDEIFLGIRLAPAAYDTIKNEDIPGPLRPYFHILRLFKSAESVHFNEKLFYWPGDYPASANIPESFARLAVHLRSIELPLSISSYELVSAETSLLPVRDVLLSMVDSATKWPDDREAVACLKAAFYCQFYEKSKYRHELDRESFVLRYRKCYYRFRIVTGAEHSSSPRLRIQREVASTIAKDENRLAEKIRMVKGILSRMGMYPLHLDDLLIDCICLCLGRECLGDARFVQLFLEFNFDLSGKTLAIEKRRLITEMTGSEQPGHLCIRVADTDCFYPLPNKSIIYDLTARLQLLSRARLAAPSPHGGSGVCGDFICLANGLLGPHFDEEPLGTADESVPATRPLDLQPGYTFILSRVRRPGPFHLIENSPASEFVMGKTAAFDSIVKKLRKAAEFYWLPTEELLYVKIFEGHDIDLITNVVIANTLFKYIQFHHN